MGEKNGIVKRVKTSLSHPLLELACRHHVYELVSGAVTESVLGKLSATGDKRKTTAPYKPLFKNLCSAWSDINTDTSNLKFLDVQKLSRTLLRHIDEAKQFLKCWLENDTVMRHDYLEMAQLCYVCLSGILPHKHMPFKLQAPSAFAIMPDGCLKFCM